MRKRAATATLLALTAIASPGCVDRPPIGPSAVIVPDAVTLSIGASQVFTVYSGAVRQFTVVAGRAGNECARIDPAYVDGSSVRVIAVQTCDGLAYVNADIGSGRTPLVAAISVVAR